MKFSLSILLLLLSVSPCLLGQGVQSDVRFFQNFFFDGSQVGALYGEAGLVFNDYDSVNLIEAGGRLGIPIGAMFELGAELRYLNYNYNSIPDRSGINDPVVSGRYLLLEGRTPVSAGGYLTIPVGDEDIGAGNVDFGIFGAVRHAASEQITIAGLAGIDFFDRPGNYDGSLRIGGGLIYRTRPGWHLIGELIFINDTDYALLTAGIDYPIGGSARLRPALGLGLDNGAPDLALSIGVLFL